MFETIQGLITNPLIAFFGVIIFWALLYLLLLRVFKLKEIVWIRLEFSWIFVGIFGLLFIVAENRKNRSSNELDRLNNYVESNLSDLKSYSGIPNLVSNLIIVVFCLKKNLT